MVIVQKVLLCQNIKSAHHQFAGATMGYTGFIEIILIQVCIVAIITNNLILTVRSEFINAEYITSATNGFSLSLPSVTKSGIVTGMKINKVDTIDSNNELGSLSNQRCEEITIPMCRGIGYNFTEMPNELNHDSQEEAGLEVHQFWPLVEIKCSSDLKFFLCSMYTPICLPEYTKPLPVCRSVCERARAGCAPLMQQYGFSWPERMSCERLPNQGDMDNLCMEQNNRSATFSDITTSNSVIPINFLPKPTKGTKISTTKCKTGKNQKNCQLQQGEKPKDCSCKCRAPLISLSLITISDKEYNQAPIRITNLFDSFYQQKYNAVGITNCAIPCQTPFLSAEEKNFTTFWLSLWSGLCAVSTLITVITFLIDRQRFKYPEKPIVFLSACYLIVSLGYLLRSLFGHESIACDGNLLRYGSKGPKMCIFVFLLIYFFSMASSVWWIILAFTWFLAAGLKWGNEAIASHSYYFHLAAWLAPTAQTVWALLLSGTAGDPIAGICTVTQEGIKPFILAPMLIYLILGTSFLLAGFVSLFRIRSIIKRQPGVKADKLEKLMIRIGIFSVLYTVPASILIVCHLYEYTFKKEFIASLACPCKRKIKPVFSLLMLRYFMELAVGITSGVWIWSGKTIESWRYFWKNIFGKNSKTSENIICDARIHANINTKRIMNQTIPHFTTQANALIQQSSLTNTSQFHIHHHLIKQAPLSHV